MTEDEAFSKLKKAGGIFLDEKAKERFKILERKGWDWQSFYNGWMECVGEVVGVLTEEDKQENKMTETKDMAAVCGCGSVRFNLRNDNKIECSECQTVIQAAWVKDFEESDYIFVDGKFTQVGLGFGMVGMSPFDNGKDGAGIAFWDLKEQVEVGEEFPNTEGMSIDSFKSKVIITSSNVAGLEALKATIDNAIAFINEEEK